MRRVPSHSSFHTAANYAIPSGGEAEEESVVEEDVANCNEEEDRPPTPDLDLEAKRAAMAMFGADAGRASEEAPRKSSLVSENSSIDGTHHVMCCAHV